METLPVLLTLLPSLLDLTPRVAVPTSTHAPRPSTGPSYDDWGRARGSGGRWDTRVAQGDALTCNTGVRHRDATTETDTPGLTTSVDGTHRLPGRLRGNGTGPANEDGAEGEDGAGMGRGGERGEGSGGSDKQTRGTDSRLPGPLCGVPNRDWSRHSGEPGLDRKPLRHTNRTDTKHRAVKKGNKNNGTSKRNKTYTQPTYRSSQDTRFQGTTTQEPHTYVQSRNGWVDRLRGRWVRGWICG